MVLFLSILKIVFENRNKGYHKKYESHNLTEKSHVGLSHSTELILATAGMDTAEPTLLNNPERAL